ncbi:serine/threonine-protein kinase ULK3-like [Watersipora subatra]|uniref:serine/threonine-protein kinase ULK3-like n=1 Tax=Watersipora subatra TaxID=2589382 RepID=UPI00355B6F22
MSQAKCNTTTPNSRLQTVLERRGSARVPLPVLPNYVFTERLGSGTYATVYKAYKKSGDRETVAIKCVKKSSLNRLSTENLLTEIELLKLLKHEHIVEWKDFEWDANYIYIITEFCGGGDLHSFLKSKRALHENLVRRFLQQIASALQYMREKNVTHLDLKPQNILMSNHRKLKIADFGFAHYIVGDVETKYLKGSPLYMAPEIICQKHYDAKADLWSVGVILYECLFGQPPWASKTLAELAEKVKENKSIQIPPGFDISDDCRDLVLRLLTRDPAKRISFEDFFAHPFLALDRVPNGESLPKAVEAVKLAIDADENHRTVEAIDHYLKSLDYFMGALHYETEETKKAILRDKIQQYLTRAELLRERLHTNLEKSKTAVYSLQELEELASSHAQLPAILSMQKSASQLEKEKKYPDALEKQNKCIERFLSIATGLTAGRLQELLHKHIEKSLAHAEQLSDYIKSNQSWKTHRGIKQSLTDSMKETCRVQ